MKAYLKQFRVSSKKASLVAKLVRNKKVTEAIDILKFTPKKTAPVLKKLIESAAANAEHNDKKSIDNLTVGEIIVTEGPTFKRRVMISKGRAHPILKRTSHITVKLEEIEPTKDAPKIKKAPKPIKTAAEAKATTASAEGAKAPEAKPESPKKA